jgi:hypothetical protein
MADWRDGRMSAAACALPRVCYSPWNLIPGHRWFRLELFFNRKFLLCFSKKKAGKQ